MTKPLVHFVLEDMEVEAPAGARFQDIVDNCGADVTFGCRNGTCGTCRIRVVKGGEHISPMNREEKDFLESMDAQSDERLGCQIRVNGDCAIDYVGL